MNRRIFLMSSLAGATGAVGASALASPHEAIGIGGDALPNDAIGMGGDSLTPGSPGYPPSVGSPEWYKCRYGPWEVGAGRAPATGPMDTILERDYAPRSSVVVPETSVPKAKYPAIDVHEHPTAQTPERIQQWVRNMDETGIEMAVVLTGATGERFDKLVEQYLHPHPGRFQMWCGIYTQDYGQPDYPQRSVAELVRCHQMGARGVGELSDKGRGYGGYGRGRGNPIPRDQRLHPDDPRLDALWEKCADLNLPVSMHQADHPSAWTPGDVYQERTASSQQYIQYGQDVPSWQEVIDFRDRMLARHPRTKVIACHFGNQGHDFASLANALDKYPNLFVDISARDYEIGRTPRAAAKFFARYRTRVLFGTDLGYRKEMLQAWWQLLETEDEYLPGRIWWRYYGLGLPNRVLESLYRGNAKRILNWEKV
jgi:hypothetical protein